MYALLLRLLAMLANFECLDKPAQLRSDFHFRFERFIRSRLLRGIHTEYHNRRGELMTRAGSLFPGPMIRPERPFFTEPSKRNDGAIPGCDREDKDESVM